MTPRVSLEALARPAPVDLPARTVVSAGRAAHHHAIALEVQHRIMTTQAAEQLAEASYGTVEHALTDGRLSVDFRGRREPLGIIGHHWTFTLSDLTLRRRPTLDRSVRLSGSGISKRVPRLNGRAGPQERPSFGCDPRSVLPPDCVAPEPVAARSVDKLATQRQFPPYARRSRRTARITNPTLAGRSPSRRMK